MFGTLHTFVYTQNEYDYHYADDECSGSNRDDDCKEIGSRC